MSQGYLIKRLDYSTYSKNQSINNDNDVNHEIISNMNDNNNSSFLLLK